MPAENTQDPPKPTIRTVFLQKWLPTLLIPCRYLFHIWNVCFYKPPTRIIAINPKRPTRRAPPIPLSKNRPRALSICNMLPDPRGRFRNVITGPFKLRQRTSPQTQCTLLTKVPAEIRVKVWEYVIGGQNLHIMPSLVPSRTPPKHTCANCLRFNWRLDHEVCKLPKYDPENERAYRNDAHRACALWLEPNGELYFNMKANQKEGKEAEAWYTEEERRVLRWWGRRNRVLALLKTCRQIYSEAVPILYESNTFSFSNIIVFFRFRTTVLPERFNSIRRIVIRREFGAIDYKDDFHGVNHPGRTRSMWEQVCEAISEMPNLRRADFLLSVVRIEHNNWILTPLKGIKVNGPFVVRIDRALHWRWEKHVEWPFEVRHDDAYKRPA